MTEESLPRLARHPLIARLAAELGRRPGGAADAPPETRRAAILLVLREGDAGEPELLLIRRAEYDGDPWSGHVACPGGRMEPGDRDLAMTAVRETREETGIDVERDGRLLGQLDEVAPLSARLPPLVVRPYVALVRADVALALSPEVASAAWVPLSVLSQPGAWSPGAVRVSEGMLTVNTFRHGDYTVWGLTERVLRQLLDRLGPGGVEPRQFF